MVYCSQGARVALLPDVSQVRGATAVTAASRGVRQSTNEVLMVAPTAFGFNEQAAQVSAGCCCFVEYVQPQVLTQAV